MTKLEPETVRRRSPDDSFIQVRSTLVTWTDIKGATQLFLGAPTKKHLRVVRVIYFGGAPPGGAGGALGSTLTLK